MASQGRPTDGDSALERLMEMSSSAILLVDNDRRYVDCNQAACRLLGMTREEILELQIEDLSAPELREMAPEMFQSFLAAGSQAGDYVLESPSGQRVACSYSASANVVPGLHLSIMIPAEEADPELDAYETSPEPEDRPLLTEREREVLTLLALGEDNQTIAAKLFISPETVRSHTRSARMHLKARSRSHAIALALKRGELDI